VTAILSATLTFGWSTPAQQAALAALRRWESVLGRPATWEQDLASIGGGDSSEKSEFTIAIHRSSTLAMVEVCNKLGRLAWTPFAEIGAGSIPLHLLPPLDDLEPGPRGRLDGCSFWFRSGWVNDKFEGNADDVAATLASLAGVQVVKVRLARLGWTEARAEGLP
jgi:hypothetical protein